MKHFLKKKEKKDKYPKVLDVGLEKDNKTIVFKKKQWKIEFTFEDLKNKFNQNKKIIFSFLGIFVLIFLIARYLYLIKAETVEVYPSSCLGGWQNPQNAAGKPDLNKDAPASSFNKNNSAYLSNAISQIYCGNFEGSSPESNLQIKRAYLTFSWLVLSQEEEQSLISNSSFIQEINIENSSTIQVVNPISNSVSNTTTETSIENQAQTSTDNSSQTQTETQTQNPTENSTTPQNPTSETQTPQTSEPETQNPAPNQENPPIINFLPKLLFSKVFAEENLTSTLKIDQQSTTNQNIFDLSNTTNTLNNTSEQNKTSSLENTSTQENSTNTEDLNQNNNQIRIPQDAFLEVLYTLDSQNWKHLGFVTKLNWKNLELDIPEVNFDNLSNLQISLKSIVSDFAPTIYLDGMILNIEYENNQSLKEIVEEEKDIYGEYLAKIDLTKEEFTLEEIPEISVFVFEKDKENILNKNIATDTASTSNQNIVEEPIIIDEKLKIKLKIINSENKTVYKTDNYIYDKENNRLIFNLNDFNFYPGEYIIKVYVKNFLAGEGKFKISGEIIKKESIDSNQHIVFLKNKEKYQIWFLEKNQNNSWEKIYEGDFIPPYSIADKYFLYVLGDVLYGYSFESKTYFSQSLEPDHSTIISINGRNFKVKYNPESLILNEIF